MLKNNNKKIINKISERTLKNNRTRNIFIILAIVLTTFMFTTVFGIGFSLVKNLSIMMLRQQGTKSSIFLNSPEDSQITKVKDSKYLVAAGIKIQTGTAETGENGTNVLLDWYDKEEFEKNFTPAISDIEGTYPEAEDEIMVSKSVLDALDINKPQKNMDIRLEQDGKDIVFKLSGWFTDYSYSKGGFRGFISENYVKKLGMTKEKDGVLCISAKSGHQQDLYSIIEKKIKLKENQEWDVVFDIQEENKDTFFVTAVCVLLLGSIIVFSGYLLIYNVMYISITKDIRFYGMLKTIGTSPSQIKNIVKKQAIRLSVIGIPSGIILGIIISFVAVPYAITMFASGNKDVMPSNISFNPFIYIGTILFAVITVLLSCRKPAKLAGKVSPIEALKYNGNNNVKYKARKGTDGGKIYKIAYRNVFREKKRAVLVFASLFMGTMAFLSVNTFIGSMKLENYVDFYLPNDYQIYTNSEDGTFEDAEQLVEQIKNIDGIKNVHLNLSADTIFEFDEEVFEPFIENWASSEEEKKELVDFYKNATDIEEKYSSPVVSVSSDMMKLYNEKARQKIDIERFEKGEICLIQTAGSIEQSEFLLGKNITLIDKESGRKKTLEIGSSPLIEEDFGLSVGYYWLKTGAPEMVLISDAAMAELCGHPDTDTIIADCDPKSERYVTSKIKEYVKTNSSVRELSIKSEISADFQSSMSSMNILGGGISAVLILIGLINFINVMLTGVYTRKGELSVMESVGMTKKQVKNMLVYEGMYYGLITIALILTLGNVIVYMVADLASSIADYATFHYPVILMFVIAAVIMFICTLVPRIVYQMVSKESITERLRGKS